MSQKPKQVFTTYAVLRRGKNEKKLAIFETYDGKFMNTLEWLELRLDGWHLEKATEVHTSLIEFQAIVPQYTA